MFNSKNHSSEPSQGLLSIKLIGLLVLGLLAIGNNSFAKQKSKYGDLILVSEEENDVEDSLQPEKDGNSPQIVDPDSDFLTEPDMNLEPESPPPAPEKKATQNNTVKKIPAETMKPNNIKKNKDKVLKKSKVKTKKAKKKKKKKKKEEKGQEKESKETTKKQWKKI